MSKKLKYQSSLTSQQLSQQFNEVCYKLGLEISKERNALKNQDVLREQQEEIETAFAAAVTREQESAAAKKRAEDQEATTKAKSANKGTTETPEGTQAEAQ